jgi:cyclase
MPTAADDLRTAAEHLMGRPVTYVVLSHSHSDHTAGSQAFGPGVPILSTSTVRAEMPASVEWMRHFQENPGELEAAIRAEREHLQATTDPRLQANLVRAVTRLEHLLAALSLLEFRLPDLTFGNKLVIHGAQRTAEVHVVAPAHTASDAYLLLPHDRILFMGDLGFFQCQPFMAFCDPEAWMAWLVQAEQLDVNHFVPGHGPLGTRTDLALQRRYIAELQGLVVQAVGRTGDGTPPLGAVRRLD